MSTLQQDVDPCNDVASANSIPDATVGYRTRASDSDAYCEGVCNLKVTSLVREDLRVDSLTLIAARPPANQASTWTLVWPFLEDGEDWTRQSGARIHGSSGGTGYQYRLDAIDVDDADARSGGVGLERFSWSTNVLGATGERFNLTPHDIHIRVEQDVLMTGDTKPITVCMPTVLNPAHCQDIPLSHLRLLVAGNKHTLRDLRVIAFPIDDTEDDQAGISDEVDFNSGQRGAYTPNQLTQLQTDSIKIPISGWEGRFISLEITYETNGVVKTAIINTYIPTHKEQSVMRNFRWDG